jgi:small subunit ribosomal protein S1
LVTGPVTKITNFGVFVGLEDGLEGLLHISELADHKVENPEDVVSVGEEIEVKILRVDPDERKIGLSRKRVEWAEEAEAKAEEAAAGTSMPETELKGGVGDSSGPLIKPIAPKADQAPASESSEEAPSAEDAGETPSAEDAGKTPEDAGETADAEEPEKTDAEQPAES